MPVGTVVDEIVYNNMLDAYNQQYIGSANTKAKELSEKISSVCANFSISPRTIQNFFKSSGEADSLPTATLNTLDSLSRVLLGYQNYEDAKNHSSTQSQDYIDDVEEDYWNYLLERVRYAKTPNGSTIINISETYLETEFLENLRSELPPPRQAHQDPIQHQEIKTLTFREILKKILSNSSSQVPRIKIVGGPGAGKTTFLKHLALMIGSQKGANDLFGKSVVPLYISLREFSDYVSHLKKTQTKLSLNSSETLVHFLQDRTYSGLQNPDFFKSILQKSQCLILLDALDEINRANREDCINSIKLFVSTFFGNPVILTSRAGSLEFNLQEIGVVEYEISKLQFEQVEKFVEIYFKGDSDLQSEFLDKINIKTNHEDSSQENSNQVVNKTISQFGFLRGIAENPLMLTMLLEVFQFTRDIPRNPYELYDSYVGILTKSWDFSRRISRKANYSFNELDKFEFLNELAFKDLDQDEPQYNWSVDHLMERAIDLISKRPNEADQIVADISDPRKQEKEKRKVLQPQAEQLIQSLEEDDGLLVKSGIIPNPTYQFRHVAFQAFFAAQYWNTLSLDRNNDLSKQKKIVENRICQDHWDLVFVFYACQLRKANLFIELVHEAVCNICRKNKKVVDLVVWLKQTTENSGYGEAEYSWRSFYIWVDLMIDLYIDRNSPGLGACREVMEQLARILREIHIAENKKLTEKTHICWLKLGLATLLADAMDTIKDEDKEFLVRQTLGRKEVHQNLDNKSIGNELENTLTSLIRDHLETEEVKKFLGVNIFSNFCKKLTELSHEAASLSANEQDKISEWAKKLQGTINEQLDIGRNIEFKKEESDKLYEYLVATSILANCIRVSRIDSNHRKVLLGSLFLPPDEADAKRASLQSQESQSQAEDTLIGNSTESEE